MAQSPRRSRITVHRDPPMPSAPAPQASPRPGTLQDISNIPPAVRLSVSDQQSSEMNKSPPATPLQDHATPVDQQPTQGHVIDQPPVQNATPRAAHPATVFHDQRIDIDPSLTQAAINPPPLQAPTATPGPPQGPPSLPIAIPIEQDIHHFEQLLAWHYAHSEFAKGYTYSANSVPGLMQHLSIGYPLIPAVIFWRHPEVFQPLADANDPGMVWFAERYYREAALWDFTNEL
jgi:hypothetical protein